MRLFAGIPVPEPARAELAAILDDLARRDWPVQWVRPEGLHLTLKFFGSVEEPTAATLALALSAAAEGIGPIPLNCHTVGAFPSGRRAKVVWIGLDAPGTLELLQDAIERACVPLGFPVEGRPFRPHITLGRVKAGEGLPAEAWPDFPPPGEIPFLAEQLVLFESRSARGGSVYSPRHTIALSPCAAV
jgi:2'-5' RNA ligase